MTPTFLGELFRTAVAAAHPVVMPAGALPRRPPSGRLIVLAAGKAAGVDDRGRRAHYLDAAEACRRTA